MNIHPLRGIVRFVSGSRGAKISLAAWLLLVAVLGVAAPGAKEVAVSGGEGSASGNNPAAVAQRLLDERFPAAGGTPALLVFRAGGDGPIGEQGRASIAAFSAWLASSAKPADIAASLPYDRLPEAERSRLYSADGRTLLLSVSLREGLESDRVHDTLEQVKAAWGRIGSASGVSLTMTGPAAIASDTIELFRNADFVLMLATAALILMLLVVIYRSPLLAVIPLVVAGIAYSVADRLIGLAGRAGWFAVDKQSLSIMMILLFAVLTDYSLFVFSRYREELASGDSKYAAMGRAMNRVAEPILFSGGTVLIAMLALFAAVFKPYRGFAPVFAVAVGVMLLAGLTLIPAVFALAGRKAFWPFASKLGPAAASSGAGRERERGGKGDGGGKGKGAFWQRAGAFAAGKPKRTAGILLLLLLLASLNISGMNYSFNLLKSFPADTESRQGFELLEKSYPPGELAPVTMIVERTGADAEPIAADDEAFLAKLRALADALRADGGVAAISPDPAKLTALPASALSGDGSAVRLEVTLEMNPYDKAALGKVASWRSGASRLLAAAGFDATRDKLLFAGQTAVQADVRSLNERDTAVLFSIIPLCIWAMLLWQTRSLKLSLAMIGTILLSFAATLGLSWAVFHGLLGYETVSYRIPVYTFVFMVALGVDYNIMLVSRIREEARVRPWREAIARGVGATGSVITSAGVILAATFGVLITQPLQELYLFGAAMAAGILLDTFVVRGLLLPSLLSLMHGKMGASSIGRGMERHGDGIDGFGGVG